MYQILKLPFQYQDLEPFIDTHTLGLHYNKHQKNYLNQLNKLLEKNNYNYQYPITKLINHINEFPVQDRKNILYNLGGVLNHDLYWKSMSNNPEKPSSSLKRLIQEKYGSYENFQNLFKEMALKLQGSGYTFLVLKKDMTLDILNLSNQEMPLSYGCIPLFTVDLWEHAYYLNYQNDRSKYLDNFFEIADFKYANQLINNFMK